MSEYQYKLKRMGASSDKYGPCEVCNKHVSDVFNQIESKEIGIGGWGGETRARCHNLFGHEECLISKRR